MLKKHACVQGCGEGGARKNKGKKRKEREGRKDGRIRSTCVCCPRPLPRNVCPKARLRRRALEYARAPEGGRPAEGAREGARPKAPAEGARPKARAEGACSKARARRRAPEGGRPKAPAEGARRRRPPKAPAEGSRPTAPTRRRSPEGALVCCVSLLLLLWCVCVSAGLLPKCFCCVLC